MTIREMHELFRVLGQQMGMQKVRGILPESIDVLLYASAVHCVRQIITSNVTTNFGNIVAIQKNKISVINALRTLYVEKEEQIIYSGGAYPIQLSVFYKDLNIFSIIDCMIGYQQEDSPVKYSFSRLIEPNLIDNVLNDYLLRPTNKYPVVTIVGVEDNYKEEIPGGYNLGTRIDYNIYADDTKASVLKTSFIRYPGKVHLDEKDDSKDVNCDLPIHLHHMVVEEAVNLYLQSVHFTSGSNNNSQETNKNNRQ